MIEDNSRIKSFVFFSHTGCLLPLLIFLNLFFGWIFFKPRQWLLIEGILILFFILNSLLVTKKIISKSSRHKGAIDVEGEIIEDGQQYKKIEN
jgi:hypothetical protein